ncbi:MAG: hypothetical protein UW69_C0022G0002 [Microgenomates group bacterium GW2011_GWA2_44_7]|nr:MAG: hypothetical protein UW69_C0022G0002 [Microgenomates group bacterium GW2011_GWA2_44_7]KKT78201.1 MAG: hypothetical protein UW73_C0005G0026 [Microgenomates group bacterium GW2011_GWB1_44_8]
MIKIVKQGLIIGIVNLLVGLIFNQTVGLLFPGITQEYVRSGLFRPWTDPLMMAFFLYPFILGLVLAYFWSRFGKQIEGKTSSAKALNFAKLYFLIATVPGMFVSYTSFRVSALMIGSWTLTGFVEAFVAGWILAKSK